MRIHRRLVIVAAALLVAASCAQSASAQVLRAAPGGDRLTGGRAADVVVGAAGDDILRGAGGNDTLVGGRGRDKLLGGAGDDVIDARDRTADTVRCGTGFDTVTADAKDTVAAGCENVGYDALLAPSESGSTLFIATSSQNNGAGTVHILLEHPTRGLPDCRAAECNYSGIPLTATADIFTESALGTDVTFGGDCAGTTFPPCKLAMNQDHLATILWSGEG